MECGGCMCKYLDICETHQEIAGEPVADILADLFNDLEKIIHPIDRNFISGFKQYPKKSYSRKQLKWIGDVYKRQYEGSREK